MATLLALSAVVPVAEAAAPYRTRDLRLADVCMSGLPWTGHAPLPLPARRPRDENGVPMVLRDGERHYWPGALAINGMKRIDAYLDGGDPGQLEQALKQAEVLRSMMRRRRGAAWLPFTFDYPAAGQRAPWYNAMTQGLGLSFFVRLYRVTGDAAFLDEARDLLHSFRRLGPRKPWVAYVDADGYLWLEHYPLRRPDHVLNAHLHATFGIYEYWQVTRSRAARDLLEGAILTIRENAERYRRPGGVSYYGLRTRSRILKYHQIHVWQLRLLARISRDGTFRALARRLVADRRPRGEVPGRPADRTPDVVRPGCRP